jgi:hypothetical protein
MRKLRPAIWVITYSGQGGRTMGLARKNPTEGNKEGLNAFFN